MLEIVMGVLIFYFFLIFFKKSILPAYNVRAKTQEHLFKQIDHESHEQDPILAVNAAEGWLPLQNTKIFFTFPYSSGTSLLAG